MGNTLPLLLPLAAAVSALILVVPTLVVRHRRRTRTTAALDWIGEIQLPLDTYASRRTPDAGPTPAAAGSEPLVVRTLRNQVRTLVEALEQEQAREDVGTADLEAYRKQVHAAIRAMGRQVEPDDSAQHVLDRVSAAVDRLTEPMTFARPTLSPATPSALAARSIGAAAPELTAARFAEQAAVESLYAPALTTVSADAAPAAVDMPVAEEVVLPVPAMAESETNRRTRRRLRSKAAA